MTSLMLSHFENCVFTSLFYHLYALQHIMQKRKTAVGLKLLWHHKWYIIHEWCHCV